MNLVGILNKYVNFLDKFWFFLKWFLLKYDRKKMIDLGLFCELIWFLLKNCVRMLFIIYMKGKDGGLVY